MTKISYSLLGHASDIVHLFSNIFGEDKISLYGQTVHALKHFKLYSYINLNHYKSVCGYWTEKTWVRILTSFTSSVTLGEIIFLQWSLMVPKRETLCCEESKRAWEWVSPVSPSVLFHIWSLKNELPGSLPETLLPAHQDF